MDSLHLKFKEIPIDGDIDDFINKMEQNGFSKKSQFDCGHIMTGRFANRNCEAYVFYTLKTKRVCRLCIYAPEQNSWFSLKSDYEDLKKQFQIKYGKPSSEYSFFVEPYFEGDGYELQALSSEKCFYSSYWDKPEGIISVSISQFSQLCFSYDDHLNVELDNKEKQANILDEI